MIRAAVQNPIAGLTLDKRLERNRAQIIYDIKKNIAIGLTQGDSYTTVAKRIAKSVNNDYTKAMLITRTETHRVREQGFEDSGRAAQNDLVGTGYVLSKTWQSMQDSSVRHTGDANHVKMDGVTVLADEYFELVGGVKAPCPGMSGTPQNDCNCRCYASRDFMSAKEFEKKTGRVLPEKYHKRKAESEATEQEQSLVQNVDKASQTEIADESGFTSIASRGIINSKILNNSVVNPMPEDRYVAMRAALEKQGVKVIAATSGDDLRFLLSFNAEASYKNGYLMHIGSTPSASAFFEEIIHRTQEKKYGVLDETDFVERDAREIEANRKLLQYGKLYGFDSVDFEDVANNLSAWEKLFKERTGVSYDESGIDRSI